jgi:hypothetical protein
MKNYNVTSTKNGLSLISEEDLADLMVAALEGGINYWAGQCTVVEKVEGKEYSSDVVAYGGSVLISNADDERETWTLTTSKLIKGVVYAMKHYEYESAEDLMDSHDAETADVIVQFALFDEIVYG